MPVLLPKGVYLSQANGTVRVKGPKGELSLLLNSQVEVLVADGQARISSRTEAQTARAVAGTTRDFAALQRGARPNSVPRPKQPVERHSHVRPWRPPRGESAQHPPHAS